MFSERANAMYEQSCTAGTHTFLLFQTQSLVPPTEIQTSFWTFRFGGPWLFKDALKGGR